MFKRNVRMSFDKGSSNYDIHSKLQKETMENLLSLYLHELTKEKKISLLDLGCGTGSFSKKISEKICLNEIHLLDISELMIKKAKLKFKNKKTFFYQCDFDSFDNFFDHDLIVSNMSLHWSKNLIKLIGKILENVVEGSIILISFPNSKSLNNLTSSQQKFFNTFPNVNELKILLKRYKFKYCINEIEHKFKYENLLSFLNDLKKVGANVSNKESFIYKDVFSLRRNKSNILANFNISYIFIRKIK